MFNVFCGGESIHVDFFGGEGIAEGGLVCSCLEVEGLWNRAPRKNA